LTLNAAKEILVQIEEYEHKNLPKFCSALELPHDNADLLKAARWSAHDYLYKNYNLEIEELYFFIDFYDMYFST